MIRAVVILALAVPLLAPCGGRPKTAPMDTVLAALAAEEAAPSERVRLFIERAGAMDVYYVDRARPDRVRILRNPRQNGSELVVIGDAQWVRTTAGWQKSAAPKAADLVPSMARLFRGGLTEATERAGPDGGRTVEGTMAWTGVASCKGKVLLRIDAAGLPSLLRFDGVCGGKPCRFRQAFSFTDSVTISAPS